MRSLQVPTLLLVYAAAASAQSGYITKTYPAPQNTLLASADLNNDNYPDLLLYGGAAGPHILYNDRFGGFATLSTLPTGFGPQGVSGVMTHALLRPLSAHAGNDLAACIAVPGQGTYLNIYQNPGSSGSFTAGLNLLQSLPIAACAGLAAADLNGDGFLDISVMGNAGTAAAPNNFVQTYFGDGTGHFANPVTQGNISLNGSLSYSGCALTDAAGKAAASGDPSTLVVDAVCAGGSGTTFLGTGSAQGRFSFTEQREGSDTLTVRDSFAGTQDQNAVFTGASQTASSLYDAQNSGGHYTFNSLNGSIAPGLNPVQFGSARAGDLNGDGIPDIAAAYTAQPNGSSERSSYISLLLGSGSGAFTEQQHFTLGNLGAASITDLNVSPTAGFPGYSDIFALTYNSVNGATTLYQSTFNNPDYPAPECNTPQTTHTVVLCRPSQGGGSMAAVAVQAASNVPNFTLSRLYLDGKSVFESTSPIINTTLSIGDGTAYSNHQLVVVSYDSHGQAYSSGSSFNVVPGGTCIPSTPGAALCQPNNIGSINGADPNLGSPTITAGALASSGTYITALRVYVDNVATITRYNPQPTSTFQISETVPMSPGTHLIAVVAYEKTGAAFETQIYTNVSDAPPCVPSGAGAVFCLPSSSTAYAGFQTPFSVGATAANGTINAIRIYVDGISQATVISASPTKSYTVNQTLIFNTLGTHIVAVVGYQSDGNAAVATKTITVTPYPQ